MEKIEALARKWCGCPYTTCACLRIAAAVREALEMARRTPPYPCALCAHAECKALWKNDAAIAALREELDAPTAPA